MKENTHPNYHPVTITCACGASFSSKSTKAGTELRAEVCSKCHPFFTGTKKLVDTAGRVDKFKKKFNV